MKNIISINGIGGVDLLIALTICAILILGAFKLLSGNMLNNGSSFQTIHAAQTGHYALFMLSKSLRMAGSDSHTLIEFPMRNKGTLLKGKDGLTPFYDQLTVYHPNFNEKIYVNSKQELIIHKSNLNNNTITFERLASNVQALQFMYGEDIDHDGSVDRYIDASHKQLNWDHIISVKIALLLINTGATQDQKDTTVYEVGDKSFGSFNDYHRRTLALKTVKLRNYNDGR